MRLVEFWEDHGRHLGSLLSEDTLVDLTRLGINISGGASALYFSPLWNVAQDAIKKAPRHALRSATSLKWAPPVRPRRIFGVGLNYLRHVETTPLDRPSHPVWFERGVHTLVAHEEPLLMPEQSSQLDWEGEVAVVMGQPTYRIGHDDAMALVAGITLFNDASVRDYQFRGPQWTLGKNFIGTGACGPWLLTPDEWPSDGIVLTTRVNGEIVQTGHTRDLLFDIPALIEDLSAVVPLEAGDMILTGTPAGVGFTRNPPRFLKSGDDCVIQGTGLGQLHNVVRAGNREEEIATW